MHQHGDKSVRSVRDCLCQVDSDLGDIANLQMLVSVDFLAYVAQTASVIDVGFVTSHI
jgi:hypothetical protein